MRRRTGIAITAALFVTGAAVSTGIASAHESPGRYQREVGRPADGGDRGGMVFVQSNDLDQNSILAFQRAPDGTLTPAGEFRTGGRGGAQTDNPFDPLASQDSLVFDQKHRMMLAVNAGSNTITTFKVRGDRLVDRETVGSGGEFPVSIAVSGDTVYVLNAGGQTNVTGFKMTSEGLRRLSHSTRELGIKNDAVPLFTDSPPQVGFSPDGKQLVVTTKSANTIEVFAVDDDGRLSEKAVSNPSAGEVPFAFNFDQRGNLLVTEAGNSAVTSYALAANGKLKVITESVESGQQVQCWITRAGDFFYASNTGSSTLSLYTVDDKGRVEIGGVDGVIATPGGDAAAEEVANAEEDAERAPGAGPIDMAAAADGKLLYVQNTLAGTVEGFRVGDDGSLTLVTTLDEGLPVFADGAGMEGIVAW